jgi:hypothetical protein
MSKITWDQSGDKVFETGTKQGVLYTSLGVVAPFSTTATYSAGDLVAYQGKNYKAKTSISAGSWDASNWDEYKSSYATGVAWNGLTAVTESPEGAEETALYADDIKYLSMRSAEEFNFTIEAYTYPDEWMQCDGSADLVSGVPGVTVGQQKRRMFGFCYTSTVGNDTEGNDYGEKIHLIYSATASPSERSYETINDSPEAITFSWECNTTAIDMPNGLKKAAEITIDTTRLNAEGKVALATLKDAIYGTASTDAYLPTPEAVFTMFGGTVAAG